MTEHCSYRARQLSSGMFTGGYVVWIVLCCSQTCRGWHNDSLTPKNLCNPSTEKACFPVRYFTRYNILSICACTSRCIWSCDTNVSSVRSTDHTKRQQSTPYVTPTSNVNKHSHGRPRSVCWHHTNDVSLCMAKATNSFRVQQSRINHETRLGIWQLSE